MVGFSKSHDNLNWNCQNTSFWCFEAKVFFSDTRLFFFSAAIFSTVSWKGLKNRSQLSGKKSNILTKTVFFIVITSHQNSFPFLFVLGEIRNVKNSCRSETCFAFSSCIDVNIWLSQHTVPLVLVRSSEAMSVLPNVSKLTIFIWGHIF